MEQTAEQKTAELEIVRRNPVVTVAFRTTAEEHRQLTAFAKAHQATVSDVIRSALAQIGIITIAV